MSNQISSISDLKLFMVLLGSKPPGRHVEQHDFFFGIASSLKELVPDIQSFWPEAGDRIHIDAWLEVSMVENYQLEIVSRINSINLEYDQTKHLFFINLGGYQENKFEEQHYVLLTVQKTKADALKAAKETLFFQHNHFGNATSHFDNNYGIDVDDFYRIEDILLPHHKKKYQIKLIHSLQIKQDPLSLGYLKLSQLR